MILFEMFRSSNEVRSIPANHITGGHMTPDFTVHDPIILHDM